MTDFGRKIVEQLRSVIANLYIENYYLNNETLKNELDKYVGDIKNTFPDIIREAIANYITNNLFSSTNEISYMINQGIYQQISEIRESRY